jgi:hypothetical protein
MLPPLTEGDQSAAEKPFPSKDYAIKAAQLYITNRLQPLQRRRLWARFVASPELAPDVIAILSPKLQFATSGERNEFIHWCHALAARGLDISAALGDLVKLFTVNNYNLRTNVARLIVRLGPQAAPELVRFISALNAPFDDVKINALDVLAAIGVPAAEVAAPRVVSLLKQATLDKSVRAVGERCLRVLTRQATPEDLRAVRPPVAKPHPRHPEFFQRVMLMLSANENIIRQMVAMLAPLGVVGFIGGKKNKFSEMVKSQLTFDFALMDVTAMPPTVAEASAKKIRACPLYADLPLLICAERIHLGELTPLYQYHIHAFFTPHDEAEDICDIIASGIAQAHSLVDPA